MQKDKMTKKRHAKKARRKTPCKKDEKTTPPRKNEISARKGGKKKKKKKQQQKKKKKKKKNTMRKFDILITSSFRLGLKVFSRGVTSSFRMALFHLLIWLYFVSFCMESIRLFVCYTNHKIILIAHIYVQV